MAMIQFSDGSSLDPDALVYVELEAQNYKQQFNEEVWNYVRKGADKPTLVTIRAAEVRVGEPIYNLDGTIKATRIL